VGASTKNTIAELYVGVNCRCSLLLTRCVAAEVLFGDNCWLAIEFFYAKQGISRWWWFSLQVCVWQLLEGKGWQTERKQICGKT